MMKPIEPGLTRLPFDLPGTVFRSPLPHSPLFDPEGKLLDAFIRAGVDLVVMLTPESEVRALTGEDLRERYHQLGFAVIYAPIPDFAAPATGALNLPLHTALSAARDGQTVLIHCHAGVGRTGVFAACLAKIVFDISGREAVNWVRQFIPRALETRAQVQFVIDFNQAGFDVTG